MSAATKRLGRPRDEAIDTQILDALFELIEEVGLGAVTMDAVADRAGVSKATIYRRWPSKEELIVDAIAGLVNAVELPDTEDIREVLLAGLRGMHHFINETTAGSVFPWLLGEVAAGSDVGRTYAQTAILPARSHLAARIARAIERGELRSDLDIELAVDMLTGPVIVRKLIKSHRDQTSEDWLGRLVDTLLEGWAT